MHDLTSSSSSFYAEWRRRRGVLPMLREEADPPPERLLQAVWYHQRLRRDQLATVDGQPVQVLHPGFWNREPGPDFRGAVVQVGDAPARSGDIEVDVASSGWRAHGHDRNPAFGNVLLHVVWEHDGPAALPTLALRPWLDAPVTELALWLGSESDPGFPDALAGECCAPLRGLEPTRLTALLAQAALVRLRSKAAALQARAREAGWEQTLWEGVFRALGYKHNVWPMQRLGELREQLRPPKSRPSLPSLQARLFGVAGLLPSELERDRTGGADYLRRLWDCWWRERAAWSESALPRFLWRFAGLRPANRPERRLALAAHWLRAGDLPARLERWGRPSSAGRNDATALLELLQVDEDEFWSWHWTLRAKRLGRPQPMLGAARVTDLAVNVILPWLWGQTLEEQKPAAQSELERRYLGWPAAEDNAVLRLARQRLLGANAARHVRGAAGQQGLLQIVRDFCEHSNAVCAQCRFPDLVREWRASE